MADKEVSWDEATQSDGFVNLKPDEKKVLVIRNWELGEVEKFGKKQIELSADVIEEDGEAVTEKKFTTTSRRLKSKLRPILEGKDPTVNTKISILMVGESYQTNYSVKELAE